MNTPNPVPRYDIFEVSFPGPDSGNPYTEVSFSASFQCRNRVMVVDGFYDGSGDYKIRLMPDSEGEWRYTTSSNIPALDGIRGSFTCTAARPGVHGPVRVAHRYHFAYDDGTPHKSVGTTCYAWAHQPLELQKQTLQTLAAAPFNKLRMCIFPKEYTYSHNEPSLTAFQLLPDRTWDFDRINPVFWQHFETLLSRLAELGIEADLILWHPYDRWNHSRMTAAQDDRYLRYAIARLSAFRNVWWSLANEFDLMDAKKLPDWDRFFHILHEYDPVQHLRSIHNCVTFYNHNQPWVTHASIQHWQVEKVGEWRDTYRKPVVIDECGYEGDVEEGWGNFTPQEHLRRFWLGVCWGGYVGHGETYYNPHEELWWSKGGVLVGKSPARIAFLRSIMEEIPPEGLEPLHWWAYPAAKSGDRYFLYYLDSHQPRSFSVGLPAEGAYRVDVLDTWEMTITPAGVFEKQVKISLPGKPYLAVRIVKET